MKSNDEIQVGDLVKVVLVSESNIIGTVLRYPVAEGDAWTIKTEDEKIVNVQHYETMWLIKKGK